MTNNLSTELYVQAHARQAQSQGVPFIVLHKGDPSSGTLIVKINLLNGTARVLVEARFDGERVWTPALPADPMPERDADAYMSRQSDIDPDAWLIEIEDKQARLFFPGKVVVL